MFDIHQNYVINATNNIRICILFYCIVLYIKKSYDDESLAVIRLMMLYSNNTFCGVEKATKWYAMHVWNRTSESND